MEMAKRCCTSLKVFQINLAPHRSEHDTYPCRSCSKAEKNLLGQAGAWLLGLPRHAVMSLTMQNAVVQMGLTQTLSLSTLPGPQLWKNCNPDQNEKKSEIKPQAWHDTAYDMGKVECGSCGALRVAEGRQPRRLLLNAQFLIDHRGLVKHKKPR